MSNEPEIIEMIKDLAYALLFIGEAITKDDQNSSSRFKLIQLSKYHLNKIIKDCNNIKVQPPHP